LYAQPDANSKDMTPHSLLDKEKRKKKKRRYTTA
jgi:hypothetical protein